jgi:hypothetical protein
MYTISVPIKRGRQEAIGGARRYIGMGGHFEGFGGCKVVGHGLNTSFLQNYYQTCQTSRLSSLEDMRDYLKNRQR